MITLITGAPGTGKSALLVSMLLERQGRDDAGPAFVSGIPELQLEHQPLPPVAQWTRMEREESTGTVEPVYDFPPNSVLVVDECQRVFRPRSQSSRVPDHVAALETHRHTGVDLWLVTQHPGLLDANVKRLVRRHIHLRSTWAGRQLLEWEEAVSPNDRGTRALAVRRRFKLPKKVFGLYKSATVHIKQSRRYPWQLALLVVAIAGVAFGVWRVGGHVRGAIDHGQLAGEAPVASVSRPGRSADSVGRPAGAHSSGAPLGTLADDYRPRLVSHPETAPLYDALRQPKTMPRTAGCLVHAGKCSCWTQQATRVDMTDAQCRGWLASPPFDPYREREQPPRREPRQEPQQGQAHVAALAPAGVGPFQPEWRTRAYVQPERTSAAGGPHAASDWGGGG